MDEPNLPTDEREHRASVATEKVEKVLAWLLALAPPPSSQPGPIGGGVLEHPFPGFLRPSLCKRAGVGALHE